MSIATAATNNNRTNLKSFPKEKNEDLQAFFSFTVWKDKRTLLTPS